MHDTTYFNKVLWMGVDNIVGFLQQVFADTTCTFPVKRSTNKRYRN